jgi:hypothetical protein
MHSIPAASVIKWSNKNVTMILIYHGDKTQTVSKRGKQKLKPVCTQTVYG